MRYILFVIIGLVSLTACSDDPFVKSTEETHLLVASTSSISGTLPELVEEFEEDNPYINISVDYGPSGELAQQIQQGAPVDLFLSGNQEWMDMLADQSMIVPESRKNFATNKLVFAGTAGEDLKVSSFEELKQHSFEKIILGQPETSPVGTYAQQALQSAGVWDALSNSFFYAKDVAQVVTFIESRKVMAGFVYYSDIIESDHLEVLFPVDPELHDPIEFPAAITTYSTNQTDSERFIEFLHSDTANDILEKHGFNRE
ncbi:molybdate ABC transporter substrate-binding protein [Oceanobacillus manasiensis]|uniref:molybdate ABC transporter substrate-binding protein n=1 Tax=Oceanobacillus manasiensis TaxID=586413 RepID=UPI0005A815AF|nr:molybdate ABC transporter substrate-binding protein [Oceanobacillus manasiensis]